MEEDVVSVRTSNESREQAATYVVDLDARVLLHQVADELLGYYNALPVLQSPASSMRTSQVSCSAWLLCDAPVGELGGEDTTRHHREAFVVGQGKVHDLSSPHTHTRTHKW